MALEAENWRPCSTTLVRRAICGAGSDFVVQLLVRGVPGQLEDENRRLSSTTLVITRSNLWSCKLRTGDFVVQL